MEAFPRGSSLANFWGLTPGCSNSGESTQRLGSITKQGSSLVRSVLGNAVVSVLRKDPWMRKWYQKIKRRRGGKIAMVAVMRRLATIIWRLIKERQPYVCGGPQAVARQQRTQQTLAETGQKARNGRLTAGRSRSDSKANQSTGASSLCTMGMTTCPE
jgi:hypothetical protein